MKHVISLSGGRTSSGPLPQSVIKKYGAENVDLVFCDTGAEHDETYSFVRKVESDLGVKITCLKLIMPKEHMKGCQYKVCDTSEIGKDYFAWKQLSSKYGNPYMPGGKFCTDQMKTAIFKKYCDDKHGKGNFYTWIGYRFEEGNRIWGKDAGLALGRLGLDKREMTQFYLSCLDRGVESVISEFYPDMFPDEKDEKDKGYIRKALDRINKRNYRFMPEVCQYDKQEVIASWSTKDFDLEIGEHEMNCLFCIEKPHGVLLLAIKDNPKDAKEFLLVVESDEVAVKQNRKHSSDVMYRKETTFRWLYNKAQELDREEILKMSRLGLDLAKKNPCSSGECSPLVDIHSDQIDLF